ncbi:hypothetical protein DXD23_13505 [Ruminococcus sp. TF12-2]|nr:hypothetical protein DWY67_13075 [Ruminococcus sp. AF26-25AA]RGG20811.1 hypothetical protein DWY44_11460 [Ruminococcus sp. AF25-19]RGG46469.1 hypothetical protein DWX72_11180 [Ruminococcus sp. AF21-11]RGH32722.1 hypothetical protein DW964_07650 [Ruminococcus sp. AM47-2BH]RGH90095.1 hypothetical protein DW733_10535 [Ruminococcus sp. AM28-13]RGI07695.1 hypothetical protein DXD23_13505 [Ruminococcus sp. TF12-2]
MIVRVGCQKCFGVTGGAPQVIPALRAVWFADFHIVASQYARQGFALAIPSSEGSDTDKKGDDL